MEWTKHPAWKSLGVVVSIGWVHARTITYTESQIMLTSCSVGATLLAMAKNHGKDSHPPCRCYCRSHWNAFGQALNLQKWGKHGKFHLTVSYGILCKGTSHTFWLEGPSIGYPTPTYGTYMKYTYFILRYLTVSYVGVRQTPFGLRDPV